LPCRRHRIGGKLVDYQRRTPLEIPGLREWIGHLVESYDALVHRGEIGYSQREVRLYRDSLISAARACNGEFKRPVKARIRELLALGAASYGLAAGVFTRDISKAHRTAKRLRAGTVWINTYHVFDAAMPFGGYKESGWGREMGPQVLENYLETKSVVTAL